MRSMKPFRAFLLTFGLAQAATMCLSAQKPELVSGKVTCDDCVVILDTVVTIGGLDGPGLHAVTRHSQVAVDRRGRILITALRQSEMSVFDSTGKFLRTVGRRGEGPGEYGSISHIGVGRQYIHVFVNHSGRTLLDHDFAVVRTDRFPGQILSAIVLSGDEAAFTANLPTPASIGHKLHVLRPTGQILSYGYDGEVYSSSLTTWTSQRSAVAGRADTLWAVNNEANRIVRWVLGQEPQVVRVFERQVAEFEEGAPAEHVYPRSWNYAAMADDRGLWIVWNAPDPKWKKRVGPGGRAEGTPRQVYDGWMDLVDPATGRTLARHRQDGFLMDFAAGSSYVVAYHETDAGVPFLHLLEPRLSRGSPDRIRRP